MCVCIDESMINHGLFSPPLCPFLSFLNLLRVLAGRALIGVATFILLGPCEIIPRRDEVKDAVINGGLGLRIVLGADRRALGVLHALKVSAASVLRLG